MWQGKLKLIAKDTINMSYRKDVDVETIAM